jgi:hypothetical protein
MFLTRVPLGLAFLTHTLALLLPPPNPAINLAAGSSAPSLNILNASSKPVCDSIRYGWDLNRRSCVEAIERLVPSVRWVDKSMLYVHRDKDMGGDRIILPWRELSCTSNSCHLFIRSSVAGFRFSLSELVRLSRLVISKLTKNSGRNMRCRYHAPAWCSAGSLEQTATI